METPSRVAVWAKRFGLAGAALIVLGPLVNQIPGVPPMTGFLVFALGLLDGLVALLLGLVGLLLTRPGAGVAGRGAALTGAGIGAGMFVLVFLINSGGMGGPSINDITTDTDDPPAFVAIAKERGGDYSYPGPKFSELGREQYVALQRGAYPDVATFELAVATPLAFEAVRQAALDLGWEIVDEAADEGRLEATDTTALFRFVDDIVVRIRAGGAGSRVDIRSRSRDGQGDVGANAARIRAFRAKLGA